MLLLRRYVIIPAIFLLRKQNEGRIWLGGQTDLSPFSLSPTHDDYFSPQSVIECFCLWGWPSEEPFVGLTVSYLSTETPEKYISFILLFIVCMITDQSSKL